MKGKMTQSNRIWALNKIKNGDKNISAAKDKVNRGLCTPNVDLIINYDLPLQTKDFINWVGRTVLDEKSGKSISIVTPYEVENIQQIELLVKKMEEYPKEEKKDLSFIWKVFEAIKNAENVLKKLVIKNKNSDKFDTKFDRVDDEDKVCKQFLKNKRRNEKSLMKNRSLVKKKKLNKI